MTWLAIGSLIFLVWLAICWAMDARAARLPRPSTDPCAESRAAAAAIRSSLRSGGHR